MFTSTDVYLDRLRLSRGGVEAALSFSDGMEKLSLDEFEEIAAAAHVTASKTVVCPPDIHRFEVYGSSGCLADRARLPLGLVAVLGEALVAGLAGPPPEARR